MEDSRYSVSSYDYPLPEEKIARFPLSERDQSKLLVLQNGTISHKRFRDIPDLLPENSFLVFNETKVIPARLEFKKRSGAVIEIFLLHPLLPSTDAAIVMKARRETTWDCMIRNLKRWNEGIVLEEMIELEGIKILLKARLTDRETCRVQFDWEGDHTFGEIIEATGKVPLPPYLKREPVLQDRERYQTVYSKNEGAVAAPTAGLHFTQKIIDELHRKGFKSDFLTLHVSAGTFKPIRENDVRKHDMHGEKISFTRKNIRNLLEHDGPVIAVGTTSMRTLESIYWYGVKLIEGMEPGQGIEPLFPYQSFGRGIPRREESLRAVLEYMEKNGREQISEITRIYIFEGYRFMISDGLITNFHMPKSTLLLLVSAFIGEYWREVYRQALENDYRFLSYGDSSLLLP